MILCLLVNEVDIKKSQGRNSFNNFRKKYTITNDVHVSYSNHGYLVAIRVEQRATLTSSFHSREIWFQVFSTLSIRSQVLVLAIRSSFAFIMPPGLVRILHQIMHLMSFVHIVLNLVHAYSTWD